MTNVRLSRRLCAAVDSVLVGSHDTLNNLFRSSGAPGDPPDLAHGKKWKEWLFRTGQDPSVDSLSVLGNVLEEFMDTPPFDREAREKWAEQRNRVVEALEADGLRYYQGGRVLPNGRAPEEIVPVDISTGTAPAMPKAVQDVLARLVRGLPRAMYPLIKRRKGATQLSFRSEYDLQDLLHALLRPWVADIRPEEFTPSYAGSSARMDFLLPAHELVLELNLVRDHPHARQIPKELIVDIEHYAAHPACKHLWCVIYDPDRLIQNVAGLVGDLEGERKNSKGLSAGESRGHQLS
jgi:REase_DpnII-MboI